MLSPVAALLAPVALAVPLDLLPLAVLVVVVSELALALSLTHV